MFHLRWDGDGPVKLIRCAYYSIRIHSGSVAFSQVPVLIFLISLTTFQLLTLPSFSVQLSDSVIMSSNRAPKTRLDLSSATRCRGSSNSSPRGSQAASTSQRTPRAPLDLSSTLEELAICTPRSPQSSGRSHQGSTRFGAAKGSSADSHGGSGGSQSVSGTPCQHSSHSGGARGPSANSPGGSQASSCTHRQQPSLCGAARGPPTTSPRDTKGSSLTAQLLTCRQIAQTKASLTLIPDAQNIARIKILITYYDREIKRLEATASPTIEGHDLTWWEANYLWSRSQSLKEKVQAAQDKAARDSDAVLGLTNRKISLEGILVAVGEPELFREMMITIKELLTTPN
jgi:hypothetical protein